ncbi:MAG: phage tail protein [Pseudomonadota bacterium]
MSALIPVLTNAGLAAAVNASSNGLQITVTEVALGNYGYSVDVNAAGRAIQTELRNEIQRVELQSATNIDSYSVELGFIAEGTPNFWVREFGFYLDDGTLFAVWSDPNNALAFKSEDNPLIVGFELSLTALPPGTVAFEANGPPLELLNTGQLAVVTEAVARNAIQSFNQNKRLDAIEEALSR